MDEYTKQKESLRYKLNEILATFNEKLDVLQANNFGEINSLTKESGLPNIPDGSFTSDSKIYNNYREAKNPAIAIVDYNVIPSELNIEYAKKESELESKYLTKSISNQEYQDGIKKLEEEALEKGFIKYFFSTSNFNETWREISDKDKKHLDKTYNDKIVNLQKKFSGNELKAMIEILNQAKELEKIVNTKSLVHEFLSQENTVICTSKVALVYDFKRLNEKLEFISTSEQQIQETSITAHATCCERKILDRIKLEHFNETKKKLGNGKSNEEIEKIALNHKMEGKILLYTKKEPCLYCYNLLKEIKEENPNLDLKVYYDDYMSEDEILFTKVDEKAISFIKMNILGVKEYIECLATGVDIDKRIKSKSFIHNKLIDSINKKENRENIHIILDELNRNQTLPSIEGVNDSTIQWLESVLSTKES